MNKNNNVKYSVDFFAGVIIDTKTNSVILKLLGEIGREDCIFCLEQIDDLRYKLMEYGGIEEIMNEEFMNDEGSKDMDDFIKFMEAESEAFKAAGIKTGRVEFICPICGGKAVGVREMYNRRISGMGSGCSGCKISHT